jgi:hypothetical protein
VERALNSEPLFGDGREQVDAQTNPNPALHRIDRSSVRQLDPQVLPDPLKDQFHLPALLVDVGNRLCRDVEIVLFLLRKDRLRSPRTRALGIGTK